MTKFQNILASLLIVQLVVTVAVFWPRQNAQAVGEPLLGDLTVDDVTAVSITDTNGATLDLKRSDDGWILANGSNYPVNEGQVEAMLGKLTAVQTNRLVTRTEASQDRLQITDDNFVRRIVLTLADGSTQTVYMGSSANAQAAHLRLAGENNVYLASNVTNQDATATASDWIDTTYVSLPRDEITAVTVENANGAFEFTKDAGGKWTAAGLADDETYDPARFNTILSRLTNLRLAEPLGKEADPAYGLDEPAATVTVTTEDDSGSHIYTLLVGAANDAQGSYVVKWSDNDYYVRVATFNAQDMVMLTHDALVATPEVTNPNASTPGTDQ